MTTQVDKTIENNTMPVFALPLFLYLFIMIDKSIGANLARKGFEKMPKDRTVREWSAMLDYVQTHNWYSNENKKWGYLCIGISIGALASYLLLTYGNF